MPGCGWWAARVVDLGASAYTNAVWYDSANDVGWVGGADLVGIDTTKLDAERVELYDARTEWNRQAKERAGAMTTHLKSVLPTDHAV